MDVLIEDLEDFTPKKIIIVVNEVYEQELLKGFLQDALRRGLVGDLEDICRRILGGLN